MDPITAIDIAVNIFSIIDYTTKNFLAAGSSLYKSDDGRRELLLSGLEQLMGQLPGVQEQGRQTEIFHGPGAMPMDWKREVMETYTEVLSIASELLELMSQPYISNVMLGLCVRRKTRSMSARLDGLRIQLNTWLITLVSRENEQLLERIKVNIRTAKVNDFTRAAVNALLDHNFLIPAGQLISTARLYDDTDDETNAPSIPDWTPEAKAMKQTNEAVRGLLGYGEMFNRGKHISQASVHSCEWAFDDSAAKPTNLPGWLKDGHGLYLIAGNEGSGKSTLMKHVFNDNRTTNLLETWSRSRYSSLVTAAFFFWRSGTVLERSEEGLLRSLLHNILEQKPEITPKILPKEWATLYASLVGGGGNSGPSLSAWRVKYLWDAFKRLLSLPINFFLVIDGLDEYQDNTGDFDDFLQRLTQGIAASQNVKVLTSSRQLDAFNELGIKPSINLHELNRDDILRFEHDTLENNTIFQTAKKLDANNTTKVLDYLSGTAKGSFLWADLAVRTVLKQLAEGLTMEQVQQELESRLPALMHDFYQRLWSSMSLDHQVEASEMLQVVLAKRSLSSSTSESVGIFRLVDLTLAMGDPKTTIDMNIRSPWADARIRSECRRVANCFTMAWPGFITVNKDTDMISTPIQFCHRSVLEFLELDETRQTLEALTKNNTTFCPHTSHLKSAVQHLKILPQPLHNSPRQLLWVFAMSALLAAKQIDSRDSAKSPAYPLLLRELDRTMQHHHKAMHMDPVHQYLESKIQDSTGILEWRDRGRNYKRLAKMHWSNFHFEPKYSHPRRWNDSFMSLAVQFGLKNYVEDALQNGSKIQKIKKGRPLLNYALAPMSIAPSAFITRELVEVLLDHGSKVDERFEKKTCWENALLWQYETYIEVSNKTVKGSRAEEQQLAEARSSIFLLLLEKGADKRISIATSKGAISVKSILERSFKQSTSAETYQDLQQFFE